MMMVDNVDSDDDNDDEDDDDQYDSNDDDQYNSNDDEVITLQMMHKHLSMHTMPTTNPDQLAMDGWMHACIHTQQCDFQLLYEQLHSE